jgi:hypothetical protein
VSTDAYGERSAGQDDPGHPGRRLPTSTVHQSRVQLFAPGRRALPESRQVETPWGTATIQGRLGQGHADVLEAMCYFAAEWRVTEDSTIELLVDKYQVRKSAAGGKAGSGEQLDRVLQDLLDVSIDLKATISRETFRVKGHLVEEVAWSEKRRITSKGRIGLGGQRDLARPYLFVRFGRVASALLKDDLRLYYDPTPIAKLRHGVSQAIARHVLGHKNQPPGGWKLDGLLKTVGAGDPKKLANRRRELRSDRTGLLALRIVVAEDRVSRAE